MSFEAIGQVRRRGAIGIFRSKWLTVPTDDASMAIKAFHELGFETRSVKIFSQEEATNIINQIHPSVIPPA